MRCIYNAVLGVLMYSKSMLLCCSAVGCCSIAVPLAVALLQYRWLLLYCSAVGCCSIAVPLVVALLQCRCSNCRNFWCSFCWSFRGVLGCWRTARALHTKSPLHCGCFVLVGGLRGVWIGGNETARTRAWAMHACVAADPEAEHRGRDGSHPAAAGEAETATVRRGCRSGGEMR